MPSLMARRIPSPTSLEDRGVSNYFFRIYLGVETCPVSNILGASIFTHETVQTRRPSTPRYSLLLLVVTRLSCGVDCSKPGLKGGVNKVGAAVFLPCCSVNEFGYFGAKSILES